MSNLEEIKIDLRGITSILKDKNSFVPKYQRSYAWKEENVSNFLTDIGGAIRNNSREYFLGSVVISEKEENKPEIVDGQQRLATSLILLAAIRDYFFSLGTDEGKERAQMIFSEYLAKKDLDTLELIPKLNLNVSDHDFFLKSIICFPDDEKRKIVASKKSHERILKAADLAKKHVNHITGVTSDPTKELVKLINYLKEKVKVISVRVPDESNAFTIFETLNDRGLALAVSDLLKNYLFYKSEDRISEVQSKWVQIISTIEAAEDEQTVINFIRNYWSSKYNLVREKELFNKIKNSITSKSSAIDLTNGLHSTSKIYSAMITCDDNFWSIYPSDSKLSMQILNFLRMIQIRPLILAILENFSISEVSRSLQMLVNVSVRFLIVGGLGGGALEQRYCESSVKINNKEINSSNKLSDYLKEFAPNDTAFKTAFTNAKISKNYLARYYLRTLEMVQKGSKEPEFIPNTSRDVITLEHILPQNPSTSWGSISEEDSKANYKRLGNMALLAKSINSDIGNDGFDAKKPYYKDSEYELTKNLSSYDKWGLNEINTRQEELAEIATKAWKI